MNAVKMTLVSTVVAAALGLALGFWATSAEAHCRGKHLDNDGNCIPHTVDQRSETFTVALIEGSLATTAECEGSSRRKQVTDAKFPPVGPVECDGLTITVFDVNHFPQEFDLHLCQINLSNTKQPDMRLTMFLTSGIGIVGGALCPDADPDDVYQGEFDATFDELHWACNDGISTCVTIDVIIAAGGLFLKKTTQPGKGDEVESVGGFSGGTTVWKPVVE